MTYETILLDRKDHVTTVTLNRPDKLNALNMQMAGELHDALAAEDRDDETRVIVITGAGGGVLLGCGSDAGAAGIRAEKLDGPRPGGQHLRRPRYREAADRLDQWRRGRRRLHDDPVV